MHNTKIMLYRKTLLTLLFISLSLLTYAQRKGTIYGYVKDGNETIIGASIKLKNTQIAGMTNNSGYFELNSIIPGSYTIEVSYIGYLKINKQILIKEGQRISLDFSLQKDLKQLEEVAVNGKTQSRKIKESGFAVNSIDTKQYANTNSDINQILSRSSGVKIREQGGLGSDFNFSINGLSGSHIKFFIDGIPMESYGSGMSLNNIPINLAERIDVYKGVVPAFLGSDALGGAVNIIMKKNKGKSLDASYSFGSFNTHRAALAGSFTGKNSGITTNVSAYYNFSDNDYYMYNNPKANALLRVVENNEFVTKDKLRRFHDGFESYMAQIESGVANKKWADVLVVGLTYTNNFKERQTGATQERVIGKMSSKGHNLIPSIRYRKENLFVEGLSASVFANFSSNKTIVTDTSGAYYQWDGSIRSIRNGGELSGEKKAINHFTGHNALAQVNLGYTVKENHLLNLTYNFNSAYREGYNEIDPYNNTYDRSNRLNKNIVGLSYQQSFFDNKLTNTLFGKYFGLVGQVNSKDNVASTESKNYYGYGLASRYKIIELLGVKASFEHAYRLPGLVELYGDRETVLANPNLKPEQSNNYNLGLFFNTRWGKNQINAEVSGFYRDANDYIVSTPSGGGDGNFSQFYNVEGIKIDGFEGEVRYDYNRLFNLLVNVSYQNAVDRQQFARGTVREKITYLSRVPNQPWLYGNADFSIGKDGLVGKGTRLQFNWFTQYIQNYSVNWSKLGDKTTNDYIPTQFIHNAALTYSLQSGKYNITLEGRNLANEIAYDDFKLQKPGRSFYIKFRYAINNLN